MMMMTTTGKERIQLREPAGAIAITYIVQWKDQEEVVGGYTGRMTNWDNLESSLGTSLLSTIYKLAKLVNWQFQKKYNCEARKGLSTLSVEVVDEN